MAHHIDRLGRVSFFAVFVAALVLGTPAHAAKLLSGYIGNMPKISGTPTTSVVAGNNYSFQPTASDPNGDPLVFSINKRPSWARFDTATGRLYGVPTSADAGRTRDIVISVSDGKYVAKLPRFTLRVSAGTAPTISGSPPTTVSAGSPYDFKPTAADPDGQALTFAVINKPTWASFDAATGRLSGTPGAISAGTYSNVGISVTDGSSTASLAPFTITVTAQANTPPTIPLPPHLADGFLDVADSQGSAPKRFARHAKGGLQTLLRRKRCQDVLLGTELLDACLHGSNLRSSPNRSRVGVTMRHSHAVAPPRQRNSSARTLPRAYGTGKRRGRDSNPRALAGCRFSSAPGCVP